jgi:hypothetical protein
MKEDGCGSSGYEGENFDDKDEIFCFEGGFEVRRVWMVLVLPRVDLSQLDQPFDKNEHRV